MPDAMIALYHVAKRYAGKPVLDDLSLTIEKGAFVALVGQSGTGKTTLLKTINRLVEIESGSIIVDGQDITALPVTDLRRRIGYVFQAIGLFPHLTVAENIWLMPHLQRHDRRSRNARIAQLLDLVSLPTDIVDRRPAQLSGGQAQRVGFARALAADPAIMLMDEPFGALDPVTRSDLGQAYRALHDRMGLTSILVTHDLGEALLLADRVIVLDAGRVIADMTPQALLHHRGDARINAMVDVVRAQSSRIEQMAQPA
jgi:osmoprotectant transport system ATP-binding protein